MYPYLDSPIIQSGMKWIGGIVRFMPKGEYQYIRYVDTRAIDLSMFMRFATDSETIFQLVLQPVFPSDQTVVVWEGPVNKYRIGWTLPRTIFDTGLESPGLYTKSVDLIVASETIPENHDFKYWGGEIFYYN